jgi:hypothetical protein
LICVVLFRDDETGKSHGGFSMNSNDRLFEKPSFWEGFLRAFDLFGVHSSFNPENLSDEEMDYEAMKEDWEMVGCDLQAAMDQYEAESKENEH